MSSTKKWSQQELRTLMKEKVQSNKKNTRIDSPLAKYDEQNNLWCLVCNQIISTDFLWSTHLIGKSHKKRVEELKLKKQATAKNPEVSNPLKRPLKNQESIPSKISRIDIDFPKKNSKLQTTKSAKENDHQQPLQNDKIDIDSTLPQDFFDDKSASVEEPGKPSVDKTQTKTQAEKEEESTSSTNLPKGFFDDPQMDAKVRKTTHLESIDAQFELFRKEIAEESLVSETIVEEDVSGLEKEKILVEIDEQLENWSKVDQIQKKIEELHKKKDHHQNDVGMDSNDSDSDDQLDLNNINFWRKKDVFL